MGVGQGLQMGLGSGNLSTVVINAVGTAAFSALYITDSRAASRRIERRTRVILCSALLRPFCGSMLFLPPSAGESTMDRLREFCELMSHLPCL